MAAWIHGEVSDPDGPASIRFAVFSDHLNNRVFCVHVETLYAAATAAGASALAGNILVSAAEKPGAITKDDNGHPVFRVPVVRGMAESVRTRADTAEWALLATAWERVASVAERVESRLYANPWRPEEPPPFPSPSAN